MLEKKLKEITLIIGELEYLKSDLKFMLNKESVYFESIIKDSSSFFRIYNNTYKLFVIELAKILDHNEHFSLASLINYLNTNRKNVEWKNKEIDIKRIKVFEEEILKLEEIHLKNIKDLRDKYYAHTDKNRHTIELKFNLHDGFAVLDKLRTIFEEIVLCQNNQHIIFPKFSTLSNEIVLLHRYKLIREMILEELKKQPNLGELQKVRDIIQGKI